MDISESDKEDRVEVSFSNRCRTLQLFLRIGYSRDFPEAIQRTAEKLTVQDWV